MYMVGGCAANPLSTVNIPTFACRGNTQQQACLFVQQILDVPARPMHFFSDTLQYNRNTYVL
jgi:hypothetical protein